METRIREAYTGDASKEYVLPFFWQHGEAHSVLREEIDAIQNSGIHEFCVESRTHEQFCEEQWWQDFGYILEEAKARQMRVWLLDDKRFPTGYANNYIETHPQLRAVRLRMEFRDFAGPQEDAAILPPSLESDESYVSMVAYQRTERGDTLSGDGIQLLSKVKDGFIWWNIPAGCWRVYYVVRTRRTTVPGRKNYIDKMSEESCKAMLHAVYEPHYAHFKEYFGNTFAGFFSDEPGFANETGHYASILGREEMDVPWNDTMLKNLAERTGYSEEKILKLLPALWHEVEGFTPMMRETYMEAVSEAYSKNFCWMLGKWCRAHGVKYIGHVIEDQNAHQRLGYGAGHFFRALDGQDMGGCDIVLHQIIPGQTEYEHSASLEGKRAEPAFFQYTLPKLASSHAHIQPLKQGRAMCEIYGAFGWVEGIPEMKYLTDLMLVSGINYFVPHAFSPKERDDDCPPHFYAHGRNTQYPLFRQLMGYLQRMCHILTGGIHQADVAVYYNAEAEWAGGRYMLQQEVCKELTRHQIDFDLIPQDTLCSEASIRDRQIMVNEETYSALIIPYSQYLPERVLKTCEQLAGEGVAVWFVDDYPESLPGDSIADRIRNVCKCASLASLPVELEKDGHKSIEITNKHPALRYYHIRRGMSDIVMIWNEDIFSEIAAEIKFPAQGNAVFYDVWRNRMFAPRQRDKWVRVRLAPAEAIVLYFGECEENFPEYDYCDRTLQKLNLQWTAALCRVGELKFKDYSISGLQNLAHELPDFGGIIRYEAVWEVEKPEDFHILELSRVGETAQLWVNGNDCGTVVGKPYRFDVNGMLKVGENRLRIEVMSNLAYRERDVLSTYLPLPCIGLVGTVYAG